MNKVHRKRTEISVAFLSGLNSLQSKEVEIGLGSLQEVTPNVYLINSNESNKNILLRLRIKKLLRSVIRLIYRNLKPVLRPITFRVRNYFTSELNQQCTQLKDTVQIILNESHQIREDFNQTYADHLKQMQIKIESLEMTLARIEQYNLRFLKND